MSNDLKNQTEKRGKYVKNTLNNEPVHEKRQIQAILYT